MICRPTLAKLGLTTILLVLLLALPGTAIAQEGGEGGGGDGGEDRASVNEELQDIVRRREALERELKGLKSIDLDSEMSEFIDPKKTRARIKALTSEIQSLLADEIDFKTDLDRITRQNWIKLYRYIAYFTLQAYLGLPPLFFDAVMFQDPLALGAFQIVMMSAGLDPFFGALFENRYGYLFKE